MFTAKIYHLENAIFKSLNLKARNIPPLKAVHFNLRSGSGVHVLITVVIPPNIFDFFDIVK